MTERARTAAEAWIIKHDGRVISKLAGDDKLMVTSLELLIADAGAGMADNQRIAIETVEALVARAVGERDEKMKGLILMHDDKAGEIARLGAQANRPKCLYCTFGEDADFSVEDLKQHIESECDFHPIPRLRKLLTAAAHALRSYHFGNASPDLAKEIADQIDASRPAGTMLNVPITAAERDRISKDGP